VKDNRVISVTMNYPWVELTRNGTRKYKTRTYYPTGTSWNRLTAIINKRLEASGCDLEFDYISTARVLV